MTVHPIRWRMAASDFHLCHALLASSAEPGSPFFRLLSRKLETVVPVPDGDVDPLAVTINSRVEFELDGEAPQTRIVVRSEFRNGLVGLTLPISTPRGLALLGLRQGQAWSFEEGSRQRTVTVRRVAWQPQAALRRMPSNPARDSAGADILDFSLFRDAQLAGRRLAARGGRN